MADPVDKRHHQISLLEYTKGNLDPFHNRTTFLERGCNVNLKILSNKTPMRIKNNIKLFSFEKLNWVREM